MLTDREGNFLSQRRYPNLALLQVELAGENLVISHKQKLFEPLNVPFESAGQAEITARIWDDQCNARVVDGPATEWFSDVLGMHSQLVFMPGDTRRPVDPQTATNGEVVSFADAYPIMMIGQSSLNDLNIRLPQPVPMNRFRPNLVFAGGTAFCEDQFDSFHIGSVNFYAAKPCSRCVLTTINQENAIRGEEPLKTLSAYRRKQNKVMFGQNILQVNFGKILKGARIYIDRLKEAT